MFEEVKSNEHEIILNRLSAVKSNRETCYVISENPATDQKQLPIKNAISSLNLGFASILVFGNAEMIYYEGEPPKNRYISKL